VDAKCSSEIIYLLDTFANKYTGKQSGLDRRLSLKKIKTNRKKILPKLAVDHSKPHRSKNVKWERKKKEEMIFFFKNNKQYQSSAVYWKISKNIRKYAKTHTIILSWMKSIKHVFCKRPWFCLLSFTFVTKPKAESVMFACVIFLRFKGQIP